jgi:hypothetical protein
MSVRKFNRNRFAQELKRKSGPDTLGAIRKHTPRAFRYMAPSRARDEDISKRKLIFRVLGLITGWERALCLFVEGGTEG